MLDSVAGRPARSRDTRDCKALALGASLPHRPSTRVSTLTGRPALSANRASSPRRRTPRTSSGVPSAAHIARGPSTAMRTYPASHIDVPRGSAFCHLARLLSTVVTELAAQTQTALTRLVADRQAKGRVPGV